jgi:predicted transcriptional regulator
MSMIGHNLPSTSGWVAFSRKLRNHSLVGMGQQVKPLDPKSRFTASRMEAWIDLIWMAAYQETEEIIKGCRVLLSRGDLIASRSFLSKRWNWSQMTVRTFLSNLEKEGMITKARTGKGEHPNLLNVCNYDHYQAAASGLYLEESNNQAKKDLSYCNKKTNIYPKNAKQPSSNQAASQPSNQAASQADNQAENSLNDCKIKENCKLEIEEQPSKQQAKQPNSQPSNQPQNINNNNKSNNLNKSISNSSLRSELESSENKFSDPDDLLREEQCKSSGNKKPKKNPDLNYTASFEEFWKSYPTDRIMSKSKTFVQWKKLDESDKVLAQQAVPIFFNHCKQNPDYRPVHAERFISQRRFDGLLDQEKQHYQPAVKNQQQGKKSKLEQIREHREQRMSDAYLR